MPRPLVDAASGRWSRSDHGSACGALEHPERPVQKWTAPSASGTNRTP